MDRRALAAFLRSRRERLLPEDVGLQRRERRPRRTPGLRREEVAERGGVSVDYYERLEQARAAHPSAQVVQALAAALRLSGPDRDHLTALAGYAVSRVREPATEIPHGIELLLDRLGPIAGYVCDADQTLVAWNKLGAALLTDLETVPPGERTLLSLTNRPGGTSCAGLPPSGEDRADEQDGAGEQGGFAAQTAAHLRTVLARHPGDAELWRVADGLAARDPAFASSWQEQQVSAPNPVHKRLWHPDVGGLRLDCQSLDIPDTSLRLLLYSADPGSQSHEKLLRLAPGR